jgi:hypothetical protein
MNGPKMGWDTGWKPGIQSIPAIAPGYKKQTYPKGAVISVGEKLYISNTAIGTPEDFNKDHWDETDVMSCISDVSGDILDDGSTSETIVVAVPSSQSRDYTVGNYYKVQGKVAKLRTKTEGDNVTELTFDTTSGVLEAINNSTGKVAVFTFSGIEYPLIADMNAALISGKDVVLIRTSNPSRYDVFYLTYRNSGGGHIQMEFTGLEEMLYCTDNVWTVKSSSVAMATSIAPAYDSTQAYPTVGTVVMHNGLRYVSNTAISTAEPWTPAHWTEKSVETALAGAGGDSPILEIDHNTYFDDIARTQQNFNNILTKKVIVVNLSAYGYMGRVFAVLTNYSYYTEWLGFSYIPADFGDYGNTTLGMGYFWWHRNSSATKGGTFNPTNESLFFFPSVSGSTHRFLYYNGSRTEWKSEDDFRFVPTTSGHYNQNLRSGLNGTFQWEPDLNAGANKTESDISGGVYSVSDQHSVNVLALTTVSALTVKYTGTGAPNFALEIDNTGNSSAVTVTVKDASDNTLFYSTAAGNSIAAGKYVQLTCVNKCWTLAEFTQPTP